MLNQLLNHKDIRGLDEDLQVLISSIKSERYYDLYEGEPCNRVHLDKVVTQVVNLLGSKCPKSIYLHYLWMVLIMAYAAEPTLKCYYPNITITYRIIQLVEEALLLLSEEKDTNVLEDKCTSLLSEVKWDGGHLTHLECPYIKGMNLQMLDETLDVFYNALLSIRDEESCRNTLLEILDDCFEGYAINPGSKAGVNVHRELFDWWLDEVIPVTWYLLPPKFLYTINGLIHEEY